MNTKLIIVDGHCSVGKSSTSKSVYKQIALNHDAYWLHEECETHPIRHQEFSFGALDTAEGMESNRSGMLKKWVGFRDFNTGIWESLCYRRVFFACLRPVFYS